MGRAQEITINDLFEHLIGVPAESPFERGRRQGFQEMSSILKDIYLPEVRKMLDQQNAFLKLLENNG